MKSSVVAVVFAGALSAAPNLAQIPLSFERGPGPSEFISYAGGSSVRLTPTGASIGEGRMHFINARAGATAEAEGLLAGYSNYLLGADPRKWRTRVPNYRRVRYRNIYPGIDVVYYGNPRELEFDFVVAPGGDPRRIQLSLSDPDLRIRLPRVYQKNQAVVARAVRRGNRVTFEVAAYDRSLPLVIDPVLTYAATFGGGSFDEGRAIAVDATGSVYVVGHAFSGNFPLINGKAGRYSFIAKVNPAGDALVYSTYIGATLGGGPSSYAIDASGSVYLTRDGAPSMPFIGPAPLRECNIGPPDLFVGKISPDGASLIYGGCLGGVGPEYPSAIVVDGFGSAYVTGITQSPDFPVLKPAQSAPQGGFLSGFVLKLRPDGALAYSTFLGSGLGDFPRAIAVDPTGAAYVTGTTGSPQSFPFKDPLQPRPQEFVGPTAFVVKITADGSDFVYSTYLGSNAGTGAAIAADRSGNAYVAGMTAALDLPTTANALQPSFHGGFLFRTGDGAGNWVQFDSGLPGPATLARVDFRNPANVYAVSARQLFKSGDRGATWRLTVDTPVSSVWISPVDSTILAVGAGGNLLRSRDAGASFTTLQTVPPGYVREIVFHPADASVIYGRWGGTGTGDGVYKSIDGGDTWAPTGLTKNGTGSGGLAIDPTHPSTIYASSNQARAILQSDDGGESWNPITSFVANQLIVDSAAKLYAVSDGGVYVRSGDTFIRKVGPAPFTMVAIDPANSSIWYAVAYESPAMVATVSVPFAPGLNQSSANIYKSSDSGATWQIVNTGLPASRPITSLEVDPWSPGILYVTLGATPDAFLSVLSPDGSSLRYSTYLGGTGVDSASAIAVDTAGNSYVAGSTNSPDFPRRASFGSGSGGFIAKFDSGGALEWSTSLGETTPAALTIGPAGAVYLTGGASSAAVQTRNSIHPFLSGDFFRTADGGATWSGETITASQPPLVRTVVLDPQNLSRVFALSDRLYVRNDGQSWTALGIPGAYSTMLVIDPITSTTMYAAGPTGLWKSMDGGVTWAPLPGSAVQQGAVFALTLDPKRPSTLYATTFGVNGWMMANSGDSGATWELSGSPTGTYSIAVDPLNPAVIYGSVQSYPEPPPPGQFPFQGGPTGYLTKSTDGGTTWTTISSGLPSGWYADTLVPDPQTPGRIYALGSNASGGIYRTDNGGTTWIAIGLGLPDWKLNVLAIDPTRPTVLYASSAAGGVYRSVDAGANWVPVPGMRTPIVTSIAIDPSNPSRIYAGAQFNSQDAVVIKIAQ